MTNRYFVEDNRHESGTIQDRQRPKQDKSVLKWTFDYQVEFGSESMRKPRSSGLPANCLLKVWTEYA